MAIRYARAAPKALVETAKPPKPKHAGGRPRKAGAKIAVSIRLAPETIAKFKATGKGWQTRMSDVLDRAEL